jgi:hypothetical protein
VTWINEHKSKLRIAFLLLLVIAINGPWLAFDAMWVPSEPPFEYRYLTPDCPKTSVGRLSPLPALC